MKLSMRTFNEFFCRDVSLIVIGFECSYLEVYTFAFFLETALMNILNLKTYFMSLLKKKEKKSEF